MPSTRLVFLLGLLLAAFSSRSTAAGPDAADIEYFEKKIRPVLAENCYSCHGASKQKASLRLDSRAALLKGGESGPAVKPGKPEESLLVQAVHYTEDRQMPPKGKLRDSEIQAVSEWVRRGAPWPESPEGSKSPPADSASTSMKITEEDRSFWSFRPVRKPVPPAVKNASWPASPIDRFVLSALEAKGLSPVGPADKRTLLRRASFDLLGLPPSPEEVDAFLKDESPDAFAKVVDRLLASPRYGERWGRYWLDVARYGEDQAHTFQARLFPYGYRYRDWVVKALNNDMPYDKFVIEQIAGDLLGDRSDKERLAATGFFALGPAYYGKAVLDELDDRVDTLTRGFLGLTAACARCHDHKFDPIPTKDYYALAGVFQNTEYKEVPDAEPAQVAAYDKAQADLKSATQAVDDFNKSEAAKIIERTVEDIDRYMVAAWKLLNKRKSAPQFSLTSFAEKEKLRFFHLDKWAAYLSTKESAEKPFLSSWNAWIAKQDPKKDLSGDKKFVEEAERLAKAVKTYVVSTRALRDALKAYRTAAEVAGVKPGETAGVLGAVETQALRELASSDGVFAIPKDQVEVVLNAETKTKLKSLRSAVNEARRKAGAKYPVIHAVAEPSKLEDMRVRIRGNPDTLGPLAPRGFLSILSSENAPAFKKGSGRLELAEAIASPNNPLTARVIVNRIWEHHFGGGIVGTPSNFGRLGERPSHPELLDYLASRLVGSGWSLKTLHREIMLSAVYRLSSETDEKNAQVDPDNRLRWRMNRRRLDVEAWRDAILAASGALNPALGGKPSSLTSTSNLRRTLYAEISRHQLDGLLRLFDFPDPNITSDKRPSTIVPLQQLFVLNSEFMEAQAKALAARLTANPGASDSDRIQHAYRLLYSREADPEETSLGVKYLVGADAEAGPKPRSRWERYAQAILGSNEFMFID